MRFVAVLLKALGAIVVVALAGVALWLSVAPPDLLRVAGAYSSKIVCSNHFIAGRDIGQVMALDVQAPGHPVLGYFTAEKEGEDTIVTRFLGWFVAERAVYRPGLGCASVPDGNVEAVRAIRLDGVKPEPASDFEWPLGDAVTLQADPALSAIISDPANHGPDMRAVVVVKDGRIIAETYGKGFGADTPLLGWSMTKTVTAALAGIRVGEGKLAYDGLGLFKAWADDGRATISLASLLAMEPGLKFNEEYGEVADVTRMLFLEPDMAGFTASFPSEAAPGEKFNYSSGTAVLVARLWQDSFSTAEQALAWPRAALFDPIGMRSAVFETDAHGTFVGGSLIYATARDWSRFGLLLLNGGEWNGARILPEDFMTRFSTPTTASKGEYTGGMAWARGPQDRTNAETGLPADTRWLLGHDGQSIAVIPSERLVVVRMGLTPSRLGYMPQPMIAKIIAAARTVEPTEPPAEEPPADTSAE